MNIKKQLSKILVYVEHIEEENAFLDDRIAEIENEVKWYQARNVEWQKKYDRLLNKYGDDFVISMPEENKTWQQRYIDLLGETDLHKAWHKTYKDIGISLRAENARLRDSLLWHPVSELPHLEDNVSFFSIDVILDIAGIGTYKAYYKHWSNKWYDLRNNKIIEIPKDTNSRWMYIPADNQQDKDGE